MYPAFAVAPLLLYQRSEAQSLPQSPALPPPEAPELAQEAPSEPEPTQVSQAELCSCVKLARRHIPALPPIRTPGDITPNTTPFVGAAVLLKYGAVHHIAVITAINENSFSIIESNYKRCQITEREIRYDDPRIRGFWKP